MVLKSPISIEDIRAAQKRISNSVLRMPLIALNMEVPDTEVYLKLENLQPIGSFKLRGAGNAIQMIDRDDLNDGVFTASMGNMAQGVAWYAKKLGIPCTIVVPYDAPETKLDAIKQLGGEIIRIPFDEWWQVLMTGRFSGVAGHFIHPVSDPNVIAGHGTIGLEIMEDMPEVDSIVIPFGGGGLSSGIASAVKSMKPDTKIYACEVETAAPLAKSLQQEKPCEVDRKPSFVEGIGGKSVLPDMWPIVSKLVDKALVLSIKEIANTIKLLVERNSVIAEGAGAASVAAALSGRAGLGKIVCVVSGGNIDSDKLSMILDDKIP